MQQYCHISYFGIKYEPSPIEVLIGISTGKERIFLEVGKALQKYVYVGAAKQRLLDCMDLAEEDSRWLTTKDQESHIHVVPLWSVASFKRMGSISRHYHVLSGLLFVLLKITMIGNCAYPLYHLFLCLLDPVNLLKFDLILMQRFAQFFRDDTIPSLRSHQRAGVLERTRNVFKVALVDAINKAA